MADRATPDWERIEADYRAGVLSLREIAAKHGRINHVAISRRAKKEGWTRDLAQKIHAKADELVTRQLVTPDETARRAVTEREVIDANAVCIARVRSDHRVNISRGRALVMTLLGELEAESGELESLVCLGERMFEPDEKSGRDRMNEIYTKVISSAGRIDSMRKLAEAMKNIIGLERQAWGLDNAEEADPARMFTQLARRIIDPTAGRPS